MCVHCTSVFLNNNNNKFDIRQHRRYNWDYKSISLKNIYL